MSSQMFLDLCLRERLRKLRPEKEGCEDQRALERSLQMNEQGGDIDVDPSFSFGLHNYNIQLYFAWTRWLLFLSPECKVFVSCFFWGVDDFYHNYHLRLSRRVKTKAAGWEVEAKCSTIIIGKELSSRGVWKWQYVLNVDCQAVNKLLSVKRCPQRGAGLASSCKGFLPLNLNLSSTQQDVLEFACYKNKNREPKIGLKASWSMFKILCVYLLPNPYGPDRMNAAT